MKKFLPLFLCLILLVFSGCSLGKKPVEPDYTFFEEYLENIDATLYPEREFGEAQRYTNTEKNLSVGILYPQTEYEFLNKKISRWIEELEKNCIKKAKENKEASAFLTVAYESYKLGDKMASIKLEGTYSAPELEQSFDVVKTFNVNIEKEKIFDLDDLFRAFRFKKYKNLLAAENQLNTDIMDKHFFDNAFVTPYGIEVIITEGSYLPEAEGTTVLKTEYESLSEMLKKDVDYQSYMREEPVIEIPEETVDVSDIDPDKPMLAMTFDDGPSEHTERLLKVFRKHGGKGTFFVVGTQIEGNEDVLRQIADDGHEIANHSWNHTHFPTLSSDGIRSQIVDTNELIKEITGKEPKVVRPPAGAYDEKVRAVGESLDVIFVNWTVDTLDWKTKNADKVYNETMSYAFDGAIVLSHDLHKTTVDAMERAIPALIEKGYQLVTVSQLLEYSDKEIVPGGMYYKK